MSRKGNYWDNAVAESFFKSLKVEWVYKHSYSLKPETKLSVFQLDRNLTQQNKNALHFGV